ncbi:hypothetical protein HNQ94_002736 [Salirhabdus euzebyi]|uniref:Competence protein ComGG n=1 Tax=Salirhabdus euzebyi TaxID=394506 RepID=A0A841Q770_9BACI|nr:hypothetical protein [Salirhabdus euzebyi]MBB6454261.1 hypothetical protein [Salirhabdus euzebyi]
MKGGYRCSIKKINNDNGFVFPFVYFLSTVLIFLLLSALNSLDNQRVLVDLREEQIKLETLFISSYFDFRRTLPSLHIKNGTSEINFTYEDGNVKILYTPISDELIKGQFIYNTLEDSRESITLNFAKK